MGVFILLVCALQLVQLFLMQRKLIEASTKTGETIEGLSEEAMRMEAREVLTETSKMKAKISDARFLEFRKAVEMIAKSAEEMYNHPERYGAASMEVYDESAMGDIVTYVAFADSVDPNAEDIKEEVSLLGNLQTTLRAINIENDNIATDYFATESGEFYCSEPASTYNMPVNGGSLHFEARIRPWYVQAKEAKAPIFTGMISDADTGADAVSCAVPVYIDGEFKGVAGAGFYLDDVREDVDGFRVGKEGFACVVNSHGQVLLSGNSDTDLAPSKDNEHDLRESSNAELAELTKKALDGETGIGLVELNGENYYIAYAPMETVSWSYYTVLPESEVLLPTKTLIQELNKNNKAQNEFVGKSVFDSAKTIVILLLIIAGIMCFLAARFSDRLAKPVTILTDKVRKIEGDNLGFEWNMDTGDEIQVLAESFGSMTDRMKQYIVDITTITADKERISAELNVAKNIQAAMLPNIFPPYPARKEFDLYAAMDPAREVGGDFYDFFFIDKDHLALVIADVSGKGVPAALFMVIAMAIIENGSQSSQKVDQVFNSTNNHLCEGNAENMFVTAWIGIIDVTTGVMTWCEAGHENPYILHADGTVDMLTPSKKKPPIASMENTVYVSNELTLKPGDCLFLYTDGVAEATSSNMELYGTKRLERALRENHLESSQSIVKKVRKDVDLFVGDAPQFDDMTMLAFKYLGGKED